MLKIRIAAILLFGVSLLQAAPDSLSIEQQKMLQYERAMVTGEDEETRKMGFDSLSQALTQLLSNPRSFSDSLSFLKSLSVLHATNSKVRILTLQCESEPGFFQHLGFLQSPDTLHILTDMSETLTNPKALVSDVDHWYGALYYNIEPFISDGIQSYLLLGYDGHTQRSRRKLIEVLTIDSTGNPSFGRQVFDHPEFSQASRFILQYSSEVGIRLNYDDQLKMIVFDHLIPMKSIYKDAGLVMVSDGSYEGFKLEDGMWRHVEKVFHEVNDGVIGEGLPEDRKKLFKN